MVDPDLPEVHDLQMRMLAGPLQGDDQDKQSAAQRLLAEVFTHMNGHWTHFQHTFCSETAYSSALSTARGKEGAAKKMGLQLGKQIIFSFGRHRFAIKHSSPSAPLPVNTYASSLWKYFFKRSTKSLYNAENSSVL